MSTKSLLTGFMAEQHSNEYVDVFVSGDTGGNLVRAIQEVQTGKKLRTIADSKVLEAYVTDAAFQLSKGKVGRGLKKLIDKLVTVSWSPQETGAGKFEISFLNGLTASEMKLPDAFLLKKNSMNAQQISSFLSLFASVPVDRRPKVIFDAETEYGASLDLLSYSKSSVRVFTDSPDGLSETALENRQVDDDSFISFYEANALAACAAANISDPNEEDSVEDTRSKIVKIYLQVQAKKRLGVKFDALDQVLATQTFLSERSGTLPKDDQLWSKQALFFFLLDQAYIDESAEVAIQKASAIAMELQDKRLEAHASRMINLSSGINHFSSVKLSEAAETFGKFGDPLGSLFCMNNQIVNDSHLDDKSLSRLVSSEIVEFGFRTAPYSDRLSSICSTAGVNSLLQNDLESAHTFFQKGENASGLRLHHLTATVNKLIATYVANGRVEDEDLTRVANTIVSAKMPKRLDYHHTYLLGNLERMANSTETKRRIQQQLIDEKYMDYSDEDVRGPGVLRFLVPHFSSISNDKNYRGHRGIFFERYGLLPINHFIWS